MKLKSASIFILFSVIFIGRAQAQYVKYDSLGVDSLIAITQDIDQPNNIKGLVQDGYQVHLQGSDFIAVLFDAGKQPVFFHKGATIHIYWNRLTADSAGGDIQFMYYNFQGAPRLGPTVTFLEGYPLNHPAMYSITVPDTGFNALQITVAADTGANSLYLDAIVLVQNDSVFASVSSPSNISETVLAGYPNPFLHSASTMLRVTSPESGQAVLSIRDMLGREVMQLPLGEVDAGEQDIRIALDRAGIFFARLQVNGQWVGAPLKITAE